MAYPADVVIVSGAYVVRQRSRRRLARSPQMHATFWPPSLSLAAFLSKPACRSEIMHTSKACAFFERAIISLVMTFGGRLLDGRGGVRLFLLGFAALKELP